MAQLIKVTKQEAIDLISQIDEDIFIVISHDLEHDKCIGRKRINKKGSKVLITNSKTFVLNKDEEEEDSFSILSTYTALQRDMYNIRNVGVKHDMILPLINK